MPKVLSYLVSKKMISLLRHGTNPRYEDRAIEFLRLKEEFTSNFPNSVRWPLRMWIDDIQKGGGRKKKFQFCTDFLGLKFVTSELSNVIRENIVWFRLCWITWWFQITFRVRLPCRKLFQHALHHCFWIYSRGQKSWKRSTNSILYIRGSH